MLIAEEIIRESGMKTVLYQIVNIGSPKWQNVPEELSFHKIDVIDIEHVNYNYPCLYLYWGASVVDSQYCGNLDLKKLADSGLILPIVTDASKFRDFIPQTLGNVNALIYDVNGNEKLNKYILNFFGIINQNRKIFISYKRSDTTGLAILLFDELTRLGFHPFLDSYSIEPGVDFQEYLKHELADSDVFVFLNSKDYPKSEFTTEEIECAQKLNEGVVRVDFYGASQKWHLLNFANITVSRFKSFLGQILGFRYGIGKKIVKEIVEKIEERRAAFYEYRRKAMIDSYRKMHPLVDIVGVNNDLLFDGAEISAICVHIPKSTDLEKEDAELNLFCSQKKLSCNKILLYDSQYCRRNMFNHLKWLNTNMPNVIQTRDINA